MAKKKEEKIETPAEETVVTEETVETPEVNPWEEKYNAEHDSYLRLAADYDNFRKRTMKEKESLYKEGIADGAEKLLTVLDNLDRAAAVDVSQSDAQSVVDGVNKILEQAKEVFEKLGIEEIPAKGETFNPELHNAVMHEENEEFGENTVSEVFLKGYKMGDRIIRHSMVKVAN